MFFKNQTKRTHEQVKMGGVKIIFGTFYPFSKLLI